MDAKDRRESCQALLGSVAGALENQPCILFKPSDLAIKRVFSVLAVTQVEKKTDQDTMYYRTVSAVLPKTSS